MLTEKDYSLDPARLSANELRIKLHKFYAAALGDDDQRAKEKFFEFAGYLSEHRLIDFDEVGAINQMYLRLQEND